MERYYYDNTETAVKVYVKVYKFNYKVKSY